MKNIVILFIILGFTWFIGSTIVQISQMNTEKTAKIILGQRIERNQSPVLDEKKVKEFIKGFSK